MKKIPKIMSLNFKKTAALLIACLVWLIPANSQEYTKKMIKEFKVTNSTLVDIFNKYGKVHVITWDIDSVRFEVDLKIKASNDQKLAKLKSSIGFEFTGTDYYVIGKTRIGSGSETVLNDLRDVAGSLISSDNQVTIDYVVKVPQYISMKLENKFGDVYIDDYNGNMNLILSYGSLKANSLNGNTSISLSSGDAYINSIKEGKLTVSYSDIEVKNAEKLTIDSRSSKVNVLKANYLKLQSRRDRYYLPAVTDLFGESYFTDFTLVKLSNELNFNFKYGNLSIETIEKEFSFININSEYTDIELIFERGSSYEIDITHYQDAVLSYPGSIAQLETKVINKEEKQSLTYGKIGTGSIRSKVKISAPKKCTINIIHK